jgi:hypothetical protein
MAYPIYSRDRIDERTIALMGGMGVGAERVFVSRTGADYSVANHREIFVPLTNSDVTAELNAAGDKTLKERQAKDRFSFQIQPTESCVFERDWNVGDYNIPVINWITGATSTVKIVGANITLAEDGSETISAEMETT